MLRSDDDTPIGDRPPDSAGDDRALESPHPPQDPTRVEGYSVPPVTVAPQRRPRIPVLTVAMVLVAVLAGGALFMSGYSLGRQQATTPGTPATDEKAFQPFWDAYHTIMERYAGGDVDQRALIEGAIKGMIEALGDPYSSYLTPEEYRQTLQDISGQFEGIGAEIGARTANGEPSDCSTLGPDCRLVIIAPIDGSPAQRAGIRPGDIVVAVDGSSLDGLTLDQARDRIRGEKGTEVVLSIVRDGAAPFDLPIVRDVIVQREVVSRDLAEGSVGYLRLTGFSDNGADEAVEALKAHLEAGRTKIVLDLRGNPGGFVTAAREVASQFVGDGPIFWQEDAKGNQVATNAEPNGVATDGNIELVVLIDRGSASASEIVAGAIKDTGRGRLVGETTFGKGTVQQWTPLEGDAGGFRLTIAKWLTPDKHWVHGAGIAPDVAVDTSTGGPGQEEDPVLDRALELLGSSAAALRPAA